MTYLRLKNNFVLRGWKGIPHALVDTAKGRTMFLDETTFQAAGFCDGRTPVDSPLVLAPHRNSINRLLEHGIVHGCVEGENLADYQKYRRSESRFADMVHWSITGRCNLRCRHCFMSAPQAGYGELTTEQCLNIVDQIAEANIAKVSLTGGEPLVRGDFWRIVDALLDKRILVSRIYTNGVLMDDRFLGELKKRRIECEIFLSFDGLGCHDWVRGVPNAEKNAVEAVKRAVHHGFSVAVETALYKGNLPTLIPTYELLKSLGVSSWKVSTMADTGNWLKEEGRHDISRDDLFEAYLALAGLHFRQGAPLEIMLGSIYYCARGGDRYHIPVIKGDGSDKVTAQPLCRSCRLNLYVMADGRLLPCIPMTGTHIEKEMPNLVETSIAEAMDDSRYYGLINTRVGEFLSKNPDCAACGYRYRCCAGCRANAVTSGGDYFGKDPESCYFFKNDCEEKIRVAVGEQCCNFELPVDTGKPA